MKNDDAVQSQTREEYEEHAIAEELRGKMIKFSIRVESVHHYKSRSEVHAEHVAPYPNSTITKLQLWVERAEGVEWEKRIGQHVRFQEVPWEAQMCHCGAYPVGAPGIIGHGVERCER